MLMTSLLRFTIRHCQSRSPGNPVSDTGTAVLSSSLSSLSLPTGQRGSAVAAPPGRRVGGRSPARRRPCQPRTAVVHLELEQLLHLVLGHAVRASRWWWLACTRDATEEVGSSGAGPQALDVELGEDAPRRGFVEPARVWRSAHEDPEGAHSQQGEQRARREGRVLRVAQHLVPHRGPCFPPGGVELRLAPVLPLLQPATAPALP